jgi:hypothetical protein
MARKSSPVSPDHIDTGLHCSVGKQRRLLSLSPLVAPLSPDQIESVQREIDQIHNN